MATATATRPRSSRPAPPPAPEPESKTVAMLVRMDEDLADEIRAAAIADDRSIAATMRVAMREFLDRRE